MFGKIFKVIFIGAVSGNENTMKRTVLGRQEFREFGSKSAAGRTPRLHKSVNCDNWGGIYGRAVEKGERLRRESGDVNRFSFVVIESRQFDFSKDFKGGNGRWWNVLFRLVGFLGESTYTHYGITLRFHLPSWQMKSCRPVQIAVDPSSVSRELCVTSHPT